MEAGIMLTMQIIIIYENEIKNGKKLEHYQLEN